MRCLLALLAAPALADGTPAVTPVRVEAAFLRNFVHYLNWPSIAFADERSPWRLCIAGDDPFGSAIDDTLRGRTEQGRSFAIVRTTSTSELLTCHVVYLAYSTADRRRAALAELANRPILTVAESPGFLQEGGMIRFQVSDHVEFAVNLDRASAASLRIPAHVLELAQEVVENGTTRRRR